MKRAEFEELKGEILETAEEISVDIKTESKQSTALEVAKQFAELESIQEVKQARGVYKTIISELDVEPSLELVAATKNAIIYFGDNEKTALIGALALNELIQSGDIRANDSLSDMEIDSIDAYRELAENWGIDFKNIREVSKALGITEHVVGLELIRSISEALEESSDARNVLFSLGLIDQETLNKENSIDNNQEHGDIEEVYDDFEDDPQYWEELEEEEENNSDSNATTETEANIDDLDI